ncbi:MAG: isoprenylcysteine carboxylmethyltransferase family protein [Bacteroidales bacterium]|nr:isoprenylcysteine carboxylmethyltransferase family protein [Bacteroidales bacterium]
MELIGRTTINPILFYSGKISGYITWIVLFLMLFDINIIERKLFFYNNYASIILLFAGLLFTVISLVNLGKSTRLGLPSEDTTLKTNGIYKFSRNPMYVGFDLITIASLVFTFHWLILILGVYSLITYHLIIKGEEAFMKNRFGDEYVKYQLRVKRYFSFSWELFKST